MILLQQILQTLLATARDVAPIMAIIFGFQWLVIRQPVPNLRKLIPGLLCVLAGMTLFLVGLEKALFPLGRLMAAQLTDPVFLHGGLQQMEAALSWRDYAWVYVFAFTIGFSTTLAEPALLAVAIKAHSVSGGAIGVWGLRIAVATGMAIGISLGTYRIITGASLPLYIMMAYVLLIIQTLFAPRMIIALAYDSGGVTTSTVTVPVVTALGLGLAETVPGRSPLLDGFGLIAYACLFPICTVMAYAQIAAWRAARFRGAAHSQEKRNAL
ncbi:MAG: hypothetical protein A3I78_08540 [Gammaproteobacteria bacterium RIFCSPLOWO2_02_FULL_56_15]|nr:MAG: hypothetical protein A3I78_08540 [Gammaproteobacteria bacterium RIFCSPLOWO2_02_FULL_56_15]